MNDIENNVDRASRLINNPPNVIELASNRFILEEEVDLRSNSSSSSSSSSINNNHPEISSISSSSASELLKLDEEMTITTLCDQTTTTNSTMTTTTTTVSQIPPPPPSSLTPTSSNDLTTTTIPTTDLIITPTSMDPNTPPLNLKEILQLFSCAISQEQAWAVLYQVLCKLKQLLETNLKLVRANEQRIDIDVLNFAKDGTVFFEFEDENDDENTKNNVSNDPGKLIFTFFIIKQRVITN